MLQLANATNEAGHHGDGNAPPTQRGGAIGARKGRVIGRSKVPEREEGDRKEVVRRNSRIPVMQQSTASKAATAKVSKAGAVGSKVQSSKVNGHAIARSINRVSTKRGREVGVRQVKGRVVGSRTAETGGGAMERSYSPPVPALAKKMKQQQSLPKKDARQHTQRITTTNENVNFIRSSSPPVPAVAKKLRNGGQFESEEHVSEYTRVASPPVPALTKTMRNHGQVESEFVHVPPPPTTTVTQPSYERTSSPPVPAVAKRLRDTGEAMASDKNHTGDMKRERSYDRASSPPVPTVAKRLQQNELSKGSIVPGKGQSTVVIRNGNSEVIEKLNSDMKLNFSPSRMILANDSDISINRPPSCKPESKPISPVATNATLPAIPMATADHHRGNQGGMVHLPPASNRQRLILQQLTMLKEGILTQQNDIDHRVQNILTRNRQCNF